MRTAVFAKDKQILGFLDHEHRPFRNKWFSVHVPKALQPTYRSGAVEPIVTSTCEVIDFEWACLCSCRDHDRGHYVVWVLIADRPELLGRVRGFQYFAEQFGELIPHTQASLG